MSVKLMSLLAALAVFLLAAVLWKNWPAAGRPVVINGTQVPPVPALARDDIAQGEVLYAQYCAACHLPDLSGAPDWKTRLADGSFPPPPHDDSGHTWHHPDFLLVEIVQEGGAAYGGTMPGFADQLSPDQIRAILAFLKSRWGREAREYQWWITNNYPTPTPEGIP